MLGEALERLLFPVEERAVYVPIGGNGDIPEEKRIKRRLAGHKAIVNAETDEPLSIVSNAYQVITHAEAVKTGFVCAQALFGAPDGSGIEVYRIWATRNGSHCHVDLTNRKETHKVLSVDDYLPFVRISNSYNHRWPLEYRIGFYRVACTNGMILPAKTVEFRINHTRREREKLNLVVSGASLAELRKIRGEFTEDMITLRGITVLRDRILPLVCAACEFSFDTEAKDKNKQEKEMERRARFTARIGELVRQYLASSEGSAYTVLCILTDYATRPGADGRSALMVNGLQRKAGAWVRKFCELSRTGKLDLDAYVSPYLKYFLQ